MSFKLLDSTGKIVDAINEPCYVRWDKRLKLFLACKEMQAQGIASHDGTAYWHLEGYPEFGIDGYETVSAVSISDEEARAIMDALDAGKPAPEPEMEIPDDGSIDIVRDNIIARMSAACSAAISNGVDVVLSDGSMHHFSLGIEDQLNLISLQGMLFTGAEAVPYHADGEECRYYSAKDFTAIATAVTNWKLYQESYFNSLRAYIQSMETMPELLAVEYGMEVPAEYQTVVLQQMLAIQVQGGS